MFLMNVSTHFWKNKNPGKRSLKIFFSRKTTCNNSLKSKGNHFMWKLEFINRLTDVWEYYTGFPEGLSSSRIPLWAGETVINLLLVIWQVNVGPKLDCFKRSSSPPPRAANATNVSGKCEKGMMENGTQNQLQNEQSYNTLTYQKMWIHYLSGPCGDSSSHFPPIKCNFEMFSHIYKHTHTPKNI